ncbi:hypothetical protein N9R79_01200 [Vibrio sp.]|nr:hypothetical protein [Vibrio sp.]
MAAQPLTKGRLAQIIIMMIVLIVAFIWRTFEHTEERHIEQQYTCALKPNCVLKIDNSTLSIKQMSEEEFSISVKSNENWIFIQSDTEQVKLESNKAWQVTSKDVKHINLENTDQNQSFKIIIK